MASILFFDMLKFCTSNMKEFHATSSNGHKYNSSWYPFISQDSVTTLLGQTLFFFKQHLEWLNRPVLAWHSFSQLSSSSNKKRCKSRPLAPQNQMVWVDGAHQPRKAVQVGEGKPWF